MLSWQAITVELPGARYLMMTRVAMRLMSSALLGCLKSAYAEPVPPPVPSAIADHTTALYGGFELLKYRCVFLPPPGM